jgi:hypothetical protein
LRKINDICHGSAIPLGNNDFFIPYAERKHDLYQHADPCAG